MPFRRLFAFLIPLLFLASCAHREVTMDTERVPALRLAAMVREAGAQIRSLQGKGSVTFETPETGGSAWFSVALMKPDSLLVQLEGPFGIDVGTLFLSRQRYVVYNSLQNTVASGVPSPKALHALIPVNLTYDEILSVFSGIFPLPDRQEPISYMVDGDQFLLRYTCGNDTCSYWVDPDARLVRRYRVQDRTGDVVLEGETSGAIEHDGLRIPRRVALSMPREDRRIAIAFSSASFNADHLSMSFTIPPNARSTGGGR